jgi:hypothetical protein
MLGAMPLEENRQRRRLNGNMVVTIMVAERGRFGGFWTSSTRSSSRTRAALPGTIWLSNAPFSRGCAPRCTRSRRLGESLSCGSLFSFFVLSTVFFSSSSSSSLTLSRSRAALYIQSHLIPLDEPPSFRVQAHQPSPPAPSTQIPSRHTRRSTHWPLGPSLCDPARLGYCRPRRGLVESDNARTRDSVLSSGAWAIQRHHPHRCTRRSKLSLSHSRSRSRPLDICSPLHIRPQCWLGLGCGQPRGCSWGSSLGLSRRTHSTLTTMTRSSRSPRTWPRTCSHSTTAKSPGTR